MPYPFIDLDMIPDKIYVSVGTLSSIQPVEEYAFPGWQEKPYSQIRNEEYICKKTLMAWANRYIIAINKEPNADGYAGRAAKAVLTDLIEKLNSI